MKHNITYEKADIIALIVKDLRSKGLNVESEDSIKYKGALSIRLNVVAEPLPAAPTPLKPATAPGTTLEVRFPVEVEDTFDEVLAKSHSIGGTSRFPMPSGKGPR